MGDIYDDVETQYAPAYTDWQQNWPSLLEQANAVPLSALSVDDMKHVMIMHNLPKRYQCRDHAQILTYDAPVGYAAAKESAMHIIKRGAQ